MRSGNKKLKDIEG